MRRVVTVAAMQFAVSMDVEANLEQLGALLATIPDEALVVTPEGAVSGYEPGPDFLARLKSREIDDAIDHITTLAVSRGQCVMMGACVERHGAWRNASIVAAPDGTRREYWKINLAQAEQGLFAPGSELPVFPLKLGDTSFKLAVQMCREIRHPEQWRHLAVSGAEVFAFVNNAVGEARIAPVWRSHLVSRAAELQRYVVGANNAAPDQKCPTMIVAPDGAIVAEIEGAQAQCATAAIDLSTVSNWVLDQSRRDLSFDL